MAYKKEHLEQLLKFVRDLYNDPECKDFADGIRTLVGDSPHISSVPKLDKIEQYLGLDYGLDTAVNPDYSFIKDSKTRDTLNADWREMLRFRFGLRGHSIDFGEFVRYANLQMEMLVNLYYFHKYGRDQSTILKVLQNYYASSKNAVSQKEKTSNQKRKKDEPYPSFLSLQVLVDALKWEFTWNNTDISTLKYIITIRNDESHRSPESMRKNIDDLKIELARLESIPEQSDDKKKDLLKRINKLQHSFEWMLSKPFSQVEQALKKLTERIKSSIVY